MTEAAATEPLDRPRVTLAGEVAARPDGLERALTRAGFHVSEGACRSSDLPADAILITTFASSQADVAQLLAPCPETPPRILLLATADPDLPAAALTLGADDAMMVDFPAPEWPVRKTNSPLPTRNETSLRASAPLGYDL